MKWLTTISSSITKYTITRNLKQHDDATPKRSLTGNMLHGTDNNRWIFRDTTCDTTYKCLPKKRSRDRVPYSNGIGHTNVSDNWRNSTQY